MVIASTEGGVDIESVAHDTPEKILRIAIDPLLGIQGYQTRKIAAALGLRGPLMTQASKLFTALYRAFIESDCSQVEVNPLVVTPDGRLLALDAKFNYIGLDGNIACLVNGAGLAMATMDIIQHAGGKPANFLDVGGGATKEQVVAAFKIILSDKAVKGILVNIFGGIMDCDVIAKGIVEAVKEVGLHLPLVVRLEGNNVEAGKKTLAGSGVSIIGATSLAEAADKIVAAVHTK
jgi:succinyl-CoA synthetase beta subunit